MSPNHSHPKIIPNGTVTGGIIENITAEPTRRVDMVFGVGYGDDLQKAKQILADILSADSRVLDEPEAQIVVGELADSSVNFVVRMWCAKENYWGLKFDMTRAIKESFDEAGIEIPFPQRTIHHVNAAA